MQAQDDQADDQPLDTPGEGRGRSPLTTEDVRRAAAEHLSQNSARGRSAGLVSVER